MKVTKQNYEKYKYLDDYRNGALEKLSVEESDPLKQGLKLSESQVLVY